jgi:shikimate 5-dehydrogenase
MPAEQRQRIVFAGITTGGSAVRRVFPQWMELLGESIDLETVDIPAGSPATPYRVLVSRLAADQSVRGAVITAHKRAVHDYAADLLAGTDKAARTFREISVLYRQAGRLHGTVIEPASIATTLVQMGNGNPIITQDADTVVYGAGGTAVSLIACLTDPGWPTRARPRCLHLTDISVDRLQHAHDLAVGGPDKLCVAVHNTSGQASLGELGPLPDRSLIVNATGLGKDRPGSPVMLPAPWPQEARVWDLNYRGQLLMLDDARAAAPERRLTTHDGWLLFINGWAESLARITGRPILADARVMMSDLARQARAA